MAVLVEGVPVIVRRDAIERSFPGGWAEFLTTIPNGTMCYDDQIARVGFMDPRDVKWYIGQMEDNGLVFIKEGKAIDVAVTDQLHGLTSACDWLEWARIPFGEDGKIAICWFFDGPRLFEGLHMNSTSFELAVPPNWDYEKSLSKNFSFTPTDEKQARLRFLRRQGNLDVYLNVNTGAEMFIGRPDRKE